MNDKQKRIQNEKDIAVYNAHVVAYQKIMGIIRNKFGDKAFQTIYDEYVSSDYFKENQRLGNALNRRISTGKWEDIVFPSREDE